MWWSQLMIDETGKRYGRLLALKPAGTSNDGRALWQCVCDCGTVKLVRGKHLRSGAIQSCGCLRAESIRAISQKNKTHGQAMTKEYMAWSSMRSRCENKKHQAWKYYGKRGIAVCERWKIFANFIADMGNKPKNTSIDRIDNDGDYEPGNCRWATPKEQAANRREQRGFAVVAPNGTSYISYHQAARAIGVCAHTIRTYCREGKNGWRHAAEWSPDPMPAHIREEIVS
jgi:hypothetical protein